MAKEENCTRSGPRECLDVYIGSFVVANATELNYADPHPRDGRKPFVDDKTQGSL
jgi:hypothetical protein